MCGWVGQGARGLRGTCELDDGPVGRGRNEREVRVVLAGEDDHITITFTPLLSGDVAPSHVRRNNHVIFFHGRCADRVHCNARLLGHRS